VIDSHTHLDRGPAPEAELVAAARDAGVKRILTIGIDAESRRAALAAADTYDEVFAAIGHHPNNATGYDDAITEEVRALAADPLCLAIGETGLDDYRDYAPRPDQERAFRDHIEIARELGKPLIIHTRAAADDTIRIMREEGADNVGGVMHCFTESWEVAEQAMEMNFYISFSGIVTFKNAVALKDVAKRIKLERILIETDSPYLAPVPHRGKINQPAFVRHVAEEIAALRGISVDALEAATTANARHALPKMAALLA